MQDDCPGDLDFWYRHISKGAWPFSTADHGWPISDCTAEGLKVRITLMMKLFPTSVIIKGQNICYFSGGLSSSVYQAVLLLSKLPQELVGEPLGAKQLYDAVNVILSLQVINA